MGCCLRLPFTLSGVFSFPFVTVNTHRIPTNLYINGKLMKLSK